MTTGTFPPPTEPNVDDGPASKRGLTRRHWTFVGLAIVAVVTLIVGASMVTSQVRASAMTEKAHAHASVISAATADTEQARAEHQAAVQATAAYLAEVAEPTSAAVRDHAGDFSPETSAQLDAAVATLTEQLATAASAPSAVEPGDGFNEPDLAASLTQRYIEGDEAEHEAFDERHAAEIERLSAIALEVTALVAALENAAIATDGAIAEAAAVGAGMYQAILDANPLASAETKDALAASVMALQTIAAADVSARDEAAAELIATAPTLFTAYGSAAGAVRASQVANTPVTSNKGGGGTGRYCTRFTVYGLIWMPCG